MSDYDCTLDVLKHKKQVESILLCWSEFVKSRGLHHDDSKLNDPTEKAMFDHWTPELRRVTFGTDEYKAALSSQKLYIEECVWESRVSNHFLASHG